MPKYKKDAPTWAELRQFGCGWWIRNIQHLRNLIEKVFQIASTHSHGHILILFF